MTCWNLLWVLSARLGPEVGPWRLPAMVVVIGGAPICLAI